MRIQSDLTKLNKFVKGVNENWAVRIGIFSDRTSRKESGADDNASIGAKHEMGVFSKNLQARSWLAMPLRVDQRRIIRDASHGMKELLALGRVYDVLKRLGFACEDSILAAFKSGGFGTWKPISKRTADAKGSTAILIETGQLRRSVASQVFKR